MAVAALPAPFVSTGGGAKIASWPSDDARPRASHGADRPAPRPDHVAIDIPAAAAAAGTRLIVVPEGAPLPQLEHATVDIPAAGTRPVFVGPMQNPARVGAFVRALVKALWAAYMLLVAPALAAAALIFGGSPFVQLTAALFLVRNAEEEQAQTEVTG